MEVANELVMVNSGDDFTSPSGCEILWKIILYVGGSILAGKKEKTVSYRRAEWLTDHSVSATLAAYIKLAATKLPDVGTRTFPRDNGQVMTLASLHADSHGGYFLHITAETPGEAASIVPKRRVTDEIEVQTTAPPPGAEFMDGDAFVYVRGNDVCLCGTAMQDTTVRYFFHEFFRVAKLKDDATQFELLKVANVDAVKFLQKQGVKEIELRAALYAATLNYHRRKGQTHSLLAGMARLIKPLFTSEYDVTEDALRLMLVVKTDGRGKGLRLGEKRITKLAADLVEHQEEGDEFAILTKTGQRIGPKEIFMRSKVSIDAKGKSVDRDKAWKELQSFYDILDSAGALEE
jgi:hypothetical protein